MFINRDNKTRCYCTRGQRFINGYGQGGRPSDMGNVESFQNKLLQSARIIRLDCMWEAVLTRPGFSHSIASAAEVLNTISVNVFFSTRESYLYT